jgi:hypothetical protein
VTSTVFGLTGCNKAKALQTVRQADELSAKLLIYGRNIALANNESFQKGNIPAAVHLATNKAADAYLKGVDVFLAGYRHRKESDSGRSKPGRTDQYPASSVRPRSRPVRSRFGQHRDNATARTCKPHRRLGSSDTVGEFRHSGHCLQMPTQH